jgi:hypothetical protein
MELQTPDSCQGDNSIEHEVPDDLKAPRAMKGTSKMHHLLRFKAKSSDRFSGLAVLVREIWLTEGKEK